MCSESIKSQLIEKLAYKLLSNEGIQTPSSRILDIIKKQLSELTIDELHDYANSLNA